MEALVQQKAKTTDLVAKLLATENITVVRQAVQTASFDLKNRVLTLPNWKEMNDAEELMLVLHECSHALFTTYENFATVFTDQAELRDYANVLEDMRAESKMKARYPGSRKMFSDGYRSLNDRDFFGVKNVALSALSLIDRINMYYKVGANCGVTFSAEERRFVVRANALDTEQEVIKLARDIYDFSANTKQDPIEDEEDDEYEDSDELESSGQASGNRRDEDAEQEDGDESDEDFEGESDEGDEEGDEDGDGNGEEDDEEGSGSQGGTDSSGNVECTTQRAFNNNLDNFADSNTNIRYFEPVIGLNMSNAETPIVGYKAIISVMENCEYFKTYSIPSSAAEYSKWKSANAAMVNYLVKEFEMKKAATAYKRTTIAKTGQLDCKKLFAYKLKEDLFKQVAQVKDGKKHGMIMLLDWSGSMNDYMHETVQQVIALASFCQRIQIPYEVYAFTDGLDHGTPAHKERHKQTAERNVLLEEVTNKHSFMINHFNLIQLFSNKMNSSEFNKMSQYLFSNPWYGCSHSKEMNLGLNGTPLNEALLFMIDYLDKFKRVNAVEKMSFVTLTDGAGAALYSADHQKRGISSGTTYDYNSNTVKRNVNILRDPITKKQYTFSDRSQIQSAALLNVIRDRHDTNVTGFYITRARKGEIYNFVGQYTLIKNNRGSVQTTVALRDIIMKDLTSTKKCAVVNNFAGYNELYIINSNIRIENADIKSVNDKMTSTQISRVLSKSLNTAKTSRVVLDRFIGQIA